MMRFDVTTRNRSSRKRGIEENIHSTHFMLRVFNRYQRSLAARPLLTQSLTTAVLFAVGDITAQQAIEKKGLEKHEFARTARMFGYGGGRSFISSIPSFVHPVTP